jgi:hypothetical protein
MYAQRRLCLGVLSNFDTTSQTMMEFVYSVEHTSALYGGLYGECRSVTNFQCPRDQHC